MRLLLDPTMSCWTLDGLYYKIINHGIQLLLRTRIMSVADRWYSKTDIREEKLGIDRRTELQTHIHKAFESRKQ